MTATIHTMRHAAAHAGLQAAHAAWQQQRFAVAPIDTGRERVDNDAAGWPTTRRHPRSMSEAFSEWPESALGIDDEPALKIGWSRFDLIRMAVMTLIAWGFVAAVALVIGFAMGAI